MKKFLRKFFIFILIPLIVASFLEIVARLIPISKISHHKILLKSQELIPKIDGNSVVFLGDSRVEWGVKPSAVLDAPGFPKGIKVINLAMPGSNGLDILKYLDAKAIYPKMILIGYTRNVGRYKNFDLDKKHYTCINFGLEKARYFINQHFFVVDQSLLYYLEGRSPLFVNHVYDNFGGVQVYEYGDYSYRKNVQMEMYRGWKESFDPDDLHGFVNSLNRFIDLGRAHGVKFLGLYMPVSLDLYDLEIPEDYSQQIKFDQYLDLHDLYSNHKRENVCFIDGSHLSHEYSYIFSELLGSIIQSRL